MRISLFQFWSQCRFFLMESILSDFLVVLSRVCQNRSGWKKTFVDDEPKISLGGSWKSRDVFLSILCAFPFCLKKLYVSGYSGRFKFSTDVSSDVSIIIWWCHSWNCSSCSVENAIWGCQFGWIWLKVVTPEVNTILLLPLCTVVTMSIECILYSLNLEKCSEEDVSVSPDSCQSSSGKKQKFALNGRFISHLVA